METKNRRARAIAFYLPQFHPIPENDEWWGKGFTEWTNVAKAKPLFRGHVQPHVPADLGFYDLRVSETREAQAAMAREAGVEGFCYWHYWFAGKRLIERPFDEVLASGKPDFPFCLGWANDTWTGIWHGCPKRTLIEQTYPGLDDYAAHFRAVLDAFMDRRYITVDGKPLFFVYRPDKLPDARQFADYWRSLAAKAGLSGIYLVGGAIPSWSPLEHAFDASLTDRSVPLPSLSASPIGRLRNRSRKLREAVCPRPHVHEYRTVMKHAFDLEPISPYRHPVVVPNWDNTPRSGIRGTVLTNSTPELFREYLRKAIARVEPRDPEHRLVFLKSWNEWAEGNYLEPDLEFGHAYLDVVRDEIMAADKQSADMAGQNR